MFRPSPLRHLLSSVLARFPAVGRVLELALYNSRHLAAALRHVDLAPFNRLFSGIEKHHAQPEVAVPTPEVLQMPFASHMRHRRRPFYFVPEDFMATLGDVLFCPVNGVVLTPDRKILAESSCTEEVALLRMMPLMNSRVTDVPGYATPFQSRWRSNYYHLVIENVPRLLALHRPPFSHLEEIKLLCSAPLNAAEAFYLSKVAPDNATVVTVDPDRLHRIERLIFTPFKTRQYAGYLPGPYVERMHELLLPRRPSRRNRRLFISRAGASTRRVENAAELLALLHRLGFEKVVPETLSVEQQIDLFHDAEVVVGTHGAALSNLLFSHDAAVVELFPTRYVIPHYYFLCKSLGHRYRYWCAGGRHRNPAAFAVDVPAVRTVLARLGVSC